MSFIRDIRTLRKSFKRTFSTGLVGIEKAHSTILHQSFSLLGKIDALAEPLKTLEEGQQKVTTGFYSGIRSLGESSDTLIAKALDYLETPENAPKETLSEEDFSPEDDEPEK